MSAEHKYSPEREAAILAFQKQWKLGCSRNVAIAATRTPEEIRALNEQCRRVSKIIFDNIAVDGGWSV